MPQFCNTLHTVKHKVKKETSLNEQTVLHDDTTWSENQNIFRIAYGHGVGPSLLRKTLLETGMTEFDKRIHEESQWNLWWKGYRFKEDELTYLSDTQRVNHHPAPMGRQGDIIKKDGLLRAVRRMCATYPKCNSLLLYPLSFNLPREESQFMSVFYQSTRSVHKKIEQANMNNRLATDEEPESDSYTNTIANSCPTQSECRNIWILKPADQSRGRGIYLFDKLEDLVYFSKSVVQRYITDPLLISGYKFDLRLYAVVPSYAPFIVYINDDGLVRFATDRFDLSNLKNVYSHLTNSSINVNGPGYSLNKAGIGCGCKWTVRQLRQWMHERNINDRLLWTRIHILIVLTLLSQASSIPKIPNAYELFGFDILIDCHLRPWLIEVNANPSLAIDCSIDEIVKKPLLLSVLEMIRLRPSPSRKVLHDSLHSDGQRNSDPALPRRQPLPPIESGRNALTTLSIDKGQQKTKIMMTTGKRVEIHDRSDTTDEQTTQSNSNDNRQLIRDLSMTADASLRSVRPKQFCLQQKTIDRFNSALNTRTRLKEYRVESCPLYGSGSEQLLPELLALGKLFPGMIDKESREIQSAVRGKTASRANLHVKPSGEHQTTKPVRRQANLIVPMTLPLQLCEHQAGRHIIPHAFGQLKLAFPFNLITRIACASERNAYPNSKIIVRAASRLVACMAQECKMKSGTAMDWTVMDIPEIWGEVV